MIAVGGTVAANHGAAILCKSSVSQGDCAILSDRDRVVLQIALVNRRAKTADRSLVDRTALDRHCIPHDRGLLRCGSAADHPPSDLLRAVCKAHGDMVIRRVARARRIAAVDVRQMPCGWQRRDLELVVRRRMPKARIAAVEVVARNRLAVIRRIGVLKAVDVGADIVHHIISEEHRRRCHIRIHVVLEVAARRLAVERLGVEYLQIGTASRAQQFHRAETAILRRIGIPALGAHRDLAPLDIGRRAEAAAVRHLEHGRTCHNALCEIEVVFLEVLRRPDYDA